MTQNTENKEGFKFNWKGTLKWTAIAGCVAGAYYLGKKQGMKQEALKHVSTTVQVQPTTVETPEI